MPKPIKATIGIQLQPFPVPTCARVDLATRDSAGEPNSVEMRIEDLTPDMLASLCDNFERTVFKNAGKTIPDKHVAIEVIHDRADRIRKYLDTRDGMLSASDGPAQDTHEGCEKALRDVYLLSRGQEPEHNTMW